MKILGYRRWKKKNNNDGVKLMKLNDGIIVCLRLYTDTQWVSQYFYDMISAQ